MKSKSNYELTLMNILREKDSGILFQTSIKALNDKLDKKMIDKRSFKPEKGESWQDVLIRVSKFMSILIKDDELGCKCIFVFTHGGFIKEIMN
mmetsp:Transcript_52842/g.44294  ORF Transcript_52842/g.44294 Transcript_52842/m.44294 type:complete len:93 (-) Transcript_52842:53-331(-)